MEVIKPERTTGDCDLPISVELVPEELEDIVPVGYNENFNTVDSSDIVLPEGSPPVTGECYECPPGYIWGCCLDEEGVDYPPGQPGFDRCDIIKYDGGKNNTWGRTTKKVINGRLWLGGELEGIKILNIPEMTVYKTIYAHLGGTTSGIRFGQFFTQFRDKVVVQTSRTQNGSVANKREEDIYTYDLDGNFIELWNIPPEYTGQDADKNEGPSTIDADDNMLIITTSRAQNPGGIIKSFIYWFDYYGTCYKVREDNTTLRDTRIVMITDNYIVTAYAEYNVTSKVVCRDKTTGDIVKSISPPSSSYDNEYFGMSMFKLKASGKSTLYCISSGYDELGSNKENISSRMLLIYNDNMDLVTMIERPSQEPLPGTTNDVENTWGYLSGVSRFGDWLLIGAGRSKMYTTNENQAYGTVYLYNVDGTQMGTLDGTLPTMGVDSNIGWMTYMDKEYVYMFYGYNMNGGMYVKRCKVNWN